MPKSKRQGTETNPQRPVEGGSRIQPRSTPSSSGDQTRFLWCQIDDDENVFIVTVPITHYIGELRERVWEKGIDRTRTDILAKHLTLWKVRVYQMSLSME